MTTLFKPFPVTVSRSIPSLRVISDEVAYGWYRDKETDQLRRMRIGKRILLSDDTSVLFCTRGQSFSVTCGLTGKKTSGMTVDKFVRDYSKKLVGLVLGNLLD